MDSGYNKEQWGELDIEFLIIDTEMYIVFIDKDGYLDWLTSKEYDSNGHKDNVKHNAIMSDIAFLESKQVDDFSKRIKTKYKRLLGEAIARSLGHDYDRAEHIIRFSEEYIKDRGREISRIWYLTAAGHITTMIFCLGIVFWIFRAYIIPITGSIAFFSGISMISGSMGAMLSISFRMGKENVDFLSEKSTQEIESRYRIISGMLSAFLGGLLVQTDMFIPIFSKIENLLLAIIITEFVAGMSERFAPSISHKIDDVK